jgi:hypothetical protein
VNIGVPLARLIAHVLGLDFVTGFRRVEYDDIYPDDGWLTPQGAAAPDPVTATIGGVPLRVRSFDGANTEEVMSNTFEIIHGVALDMVNDETLKLEWHAHVAPSTTGAGTARIFFDYMYWPVCNGAISAPVPCDSVYVDIEIEADSQYCHYVEGVEIPMPTGGIQIGGKFGINIRRTPTDEADTYEADVFVLQAAMHAPFDSRGSRERYVK